MTKESEAGDDRRLQKYMDSEEFRASLQEGFDQIERGECTVIRGEEELRQFFKDIHEEAKRRIALKD